jgi:hypothetical protein
MANRIFRDMPCQMGRLQRLASFPSGGPDLRVAGVWRRYAPPTPIEARQTNVSLINQI